MATLMSILLASFQTYSVLGVLHLVLFIWALFQILASSMSLGSKLLWIFIVFIFPLVGLILYYLLGRKA